LRCARAQSRRGGLCPHGHGPALVAPARIGQLTTEGPPMNLADNLIRTDAEYPDRPAVRLDDAVLTYSDLDERSARIAGLLREHAVRPGDRVAVMLPNIPEFPVIYYGILRAGAVVVPMNPLLKEREVAYYLGDSQAALIFAWHTCADQAAAGAARADATCVVVGAGFDD